MAKKQNNALVLRNVRLVWCQLKEPVSYVEGEGYQVDAVNGKYQTGILIPKDSIIEETLNAEIARIKQEALVSGIRTSKGVYELATKDLARFSDNITDGDTKKYEYTQGHYFITAKTNAINPPSVVDTNNNALDSGEVYSGAIANVALNVKPYAVGNNLGISYYLVAVQFTGEGEPLGNFVDVNTIFGDKIVKTVDSKQEGYDDLI